MALIGKIQEKSWLLLVVIGVAMLAFIIPWDQIFGQQQQQDTIGLGTVNGEMVDGEDLETYKNNALQQIGQRKQQQSPGQQVQLDANDLATAEAQAWNAAVGNNLAIKEFEKLGLSVDELELENIKFGEEGYSPSPFLSGIVDSTSGQFSSELARQQLESYQVQDPEGYANFIEQMKLNRMEEKYNALLKAGVQTTTLEAKNDYLATKEVKNVSVVYKRFNEVKDLVEVSDEEAKAYYSSHKDDKKFEQQATRKVTYFTIPVSPSADDSLRTQEKLLKLKPKFEASKNDSLFVARYSKNVQNLSTKTFEPADTYGGNGQSLTYPASLAPVLAQAQAGDVIGPVNLTGTIGLGKIVSTTTKPQAYVRHILLKAPETDVAAVAKAKAKADSIIRVIKANNNFGEMVTMFSEDPGSKNNGGEYKYFNEGVMVPSFNDFSFNKPTGSIEAVQTNYGIHIVEVLGKRNVVVPTMYVVERPVDITSSTTAIAKAEASALIEDITTALADENDLTKKSKIFDSLAREAGYTVRPANIRDESPSVAQVSPGAEGKLLRLAFEEDNKPGMINPFPIIDNKNLVVGYYAEKIEKGAGSFESLKDRMIAEVRKEKQAEILKKQMSVSSNIEALAEAMDTKVITEGVTFNARSIPAIGVEAKLVGAIFSGLKEGETTASPIVGTNGVFMVRIDNVVPAAETTDFSSEKLQLTQKAQSTITNRYRSALVKEADVIDNRKLRTYGIR